MKNTFGFAFRVASEGRFFEPNLTLADDARRLPVRPSAPGHHQPHPASSPTPDHHPAALALVVVAAVDDRERVKFEIWNRSNWSKQVTVCYA